MDARIAPHNGRLPPRVPPAMTLSFEVFPPKTEAGAEKLWDAVEKLSVFQPQFVSVTCGAGGSAVEGTASTVKRVQALGLEAVPHMAIARQSRTRLREVLRAYKDGGVRRVVAIRGDDPAPLKATQDAGAKSSVASADFGDDVYANTIDFVRELKHEFGIDPIVAAYPDVHPRALSPAQDLDHLRRKVEAGAALAVSQFFFLAETFLRFRDRLATEGIFLPLAAGIMPIQNLAQAVKFAGGCGTIVPDGFAGRFERHGTNEKALFDEGVAHTAEVCEKLKSEGVSHFHFYTLNRSEMTESVCRNLGFGVQGSGFREKYAEP